MNPPTSHFGSPAEVEVSNPESPFASAVDALTLAVSRASNGHPLDFADFLAGVVTAVAANAGGLDVLLAARSGSWEAGLVAQLVEGTVGMDPQELWAHRTTPVVVPLHVAELVEARYGLPGLPAALDRIDERYESTTEAAAEVFDGEAFDAEIASIVESWRVAYRAYGQAFTRAVQARAAGLTRLRVPVTVRVVDDPRIPWWRPQDQTIQNPHEDGDPLVLLLWESAVEVVPLPVDEYGHLTPLPDTDPADARQDLS